MFLIVYYLIVSALAAKCSTTQANCDGDKCEMVGTTEICTQCKTEGQVPIDGVCKQKGDKEVTDAGCTKTGGSADLSTVKVCSSCTGTNYFLFMGGCYSQAKAPGSSICTAAKGGKCTTCNINDNYIFKNPADAPTLGSECILCSDATDRNGYKGVTGCSQCTKADSTAGAATCDTCQKGYYKDGQACTQCANTCATCEKAADRCTSCPEGKYLNGNTCVEDCGSDKYADPTTNACKSCATETGIPECTACTYSSSLQKPVCSACGGSKPLLKTAIDGTTTCVAKDACKDDYFPKEDNSKGNKCISCGDADAGVPNCAKCNPPTGNAKPICTACGSSYTLDSQANTCASTGANRSGLSTGAIAGISVAAVVVVGGLVGFLCWWFICRGKA